MKNIYQVLNEFNHLLGERPLSIRPSMCSDSIIYFRMLYSETVDPLNTVKNWGQDYNAGSVYGMARVALVDDEWGHVQTVMPNDGLYTNSYVMPDAALAARYIAACKQFIPGWMPSCATNSTFQPVFLSNRILQFALRDTERNISYYSSKLQKILSGEYHINELQDATSNLHDCADTMRKLLRLMASRDTLPQALKDEVARKLTEV